ncbi:hypothetical protein DQ392_08630 [Streptomyces reniochalinae]|uniref:Uncharacterized protein n=1 Tax=Streptomyces reniochalinae TaxID=2250578 RepID=A0A367EUQ6_9ACTN|nr:hypothetical protein DQ392_08630 [Streptomyces reniochalinae]
MLPFAVACSSGDEPSHKPSKAAAAKPADDGCGKDSDLSQADWAELCGPDAVGNGGKPRKPQEAKENKLGQKQATIGGDGTGELEITPTSVVYVDKATGETPDNDLFAVVTVKDKASNAVDASEEAPAGGGGWKWAAPNGQAIGDGDGNAAFNVVPEGFNGGGDIAAGTWAWDSAVFDISEAQRGGTLLYTDGAGTTYRWTMPKTDTGPEVVKLKKGLAY